MAKLLEGSWPAVEQGVCASRKDMMKFSTPLSNPAWFASPVKAKGNFAGVWHQQISEDKLRNLRK